MKIKLISLFIIIFFSSATVRAQEKEVSDYEHIVSGECVTQNGFFFTEEGMIKLVTTVEEKIKLTGLEKQKEVDFLKIDLDTCKKKSKIELEIQKEMFEKQLLAKQQVIDSYKSQSYWNLLKIGTGVVAGVGVGIIIGLLVK